MQCEETICPLQSSAKNMQSNGQPFKSCVFAEYTGHLILVPKVEPTIMLMDFYGVY
jgi:hypothetical protein